jgi:hypothetical protein
MVLEQIGVKEHWSAGVSPASVLFLRAGRPRSNLENVFHHPK